MKQNFDIDLNPEQLKAVNHLDGPLLIFAGAGSGKTRVITARVANLINNCHVPPWSILAVTFTNKAAGEMRERITQMAGELAANVMIKTFHSACLYILRYDGHYLGLPSNFTIYDSQDSENLIKQILKLMDLDPKKISPSAISHIISRQKEKLIEPAEMAKNVSGGDDFFHEISARVYGKYQELLEKNQAVDFDDLLAKPVKLFLNFPDVLQKYQDMWKYILVDEYQDTNRVQYLFCKLLSKDHRNLCVVGDDDQSIYSWRGADIRNILDFQKDYPEAQVIKLEENYRSTSNILDAAFHVVKRIEGRVDKALWTSKEGGENIVQAFLYDEYEEADWCVEKAETLKLRNGIDLGEMSIFYRMNYQSRVFEEILLRKGIPYIIFGGMKFYDRKEVKDILAYLRFLINIRDDLSLSRIINSPPRGIGSVTVEKLRKIAEAENISLWESLLRDKANKKIEFFVTMVKSFLESISGIGEKLNLFEFVSNVANESGYIKHLEKEGSIENESRLQNIEELINSIAEREEKWSENRGDQFLLENFLQEIGLFTDAEDPDKDEKRKNSLTLMTVHNAKGLEYKAVFLCGMEEGIFPHNRAVSDESGGGSEEMDEERRLCYVGITRAKEHLFITSAGMRRSYGSSIPRVPSRFLEDIPPNLVDRWQREGFQDNYHKTGRSRSTERTYQFAKEKEKKDTRSSGGQVISQKGFLTGQYVVHPRYGRGTIENIAKNGNMVRLYISFGGMKAKAFIESLTPLEPV